MSLLRLGLSKSLASILIRHLLSHSLIPLLLQFLALMETGYHIVSCPMERPLCHGTERGLLAIASEIQVLGPASHRKLNPASTMLVSMELILGMILGDSLIATPWETLSQGNLY